MSNANSGSLQSNEVPPEQSTYEIDSEEEFWLEHTDLEFDLDDGLYVEPDPVSDSDDSFSDNDAYPDSGPNPPYLTSFRPNTAKNLGLTNKEHRRLVDGIIPVNGKANIVDQLDLFTRYVKRLKETPDMPAARIVTELLQLANACCVEYFAGNRKFYYQIENKLDLDRVIAYMTRMKRSPSAFLSDDSTLRAGIIATSSRTHHGLFSKYRGFYKDLDDLQNQAVDDLSNVTTYGMSLPSWQRDTSKEYHLTRDGKWNSSAPPTTREYNFTVSVVQNVNPAGAYQNLTLINGKFPGPVIEANTGDRIVVHYHNQADVPTSLHFHGMFMRNTNHMDGVHGITQCGISPGASFTYDFTLNDQWGTYWYHSHYSTQYLDGVVGPLVIHSPEEDALGYEYDEEIIILLQETYFKNSQDLLKNYIAPRVENQEPIPDSGLIQGRNYFDCSVLDIKGSEEESRYWLDHYECKNSTETVVPVNNDKTYRLRVINAAGFSEFDFSVDEHVLTVIEADGTNTEPLTTEVVRMANGQRYSLLLKTDKQKVADLFWMRASMQTFCYDGENRHLNPDLKAILSYPAFTKEIQRINLHKMDESGLSNEEFQLPRRPTTEKSHQLDGTVDCVELNSTLLVPRIAQKAPDSTYFTSIDASFMTGGMQISRAYFNDSTYTSLSDTSTLGEVHRRIHEGDHSVLVNSSNTPGWANNNMVVTLNEPKVVDLLINNYDDGGHPFHLHGHQFWILASGSGYFDVDYYKNINVTNPIRRDVVQIDQFGWALIRFIADNPGVWAFHCHILWHSSAGMMMQFNVMPDKLAEENIPASWYKLCGARS